MSDYYRSNGGWYNKDGDDGPYAKEGDTFTLMAGGTGGGGCAVDVLGTVVPAFNNNTGKPVDGDTLQVTLDKLTTFDKNFPTEVRAVSLVGFTPKNAKIANEDTIQVAFEKVQGQIDALPTPPTVYTDAKVRAVKLTGLVTTTAAPVTADDTVLTAPGKLQAQIDEINSGGQGVPDVLNTKMTGLVVTDKTHGVPEDTILKFAGKAEARIRNLESNGAPFNLMAYKFGAPMSENARPADGDTFEKWQRKVNYLFTRLTEAEKVNTDLVARLKKVYNELGWSWTDGTP